MREQSKVAKLPWYCESSAPNRNSKSSGGGETENSFNRYISPDVFKKNYNLEPNGSEFWEFRRYFGGAVDPQTEKFCKAFYGNNWADYLDNICDGISKEDCPSTEDCGKYEDWFDADVSNQEMAILLEQEGESQEEIDAFLGVSGLFF